MSAELPDDERPGTNSSVSYEQQNVEISCNFFLWLKVPKVGLPHEMFVDSRRQIWSKLLTETNLGVTPALLVP